MIDRRRAIRYLCALTASFAASRSWRRGESPSFYVAGARFFPKQPVRVNDTVVLRPTPLDDHRACRVETIDGAPLGWVPKELIGKIGETRRGRVEQVALDGVPWRWYRISA